MQAKRATEAQVIPGTVTLTMTDEEAGTLAMMMLYGFEWSKAHDGDMVANVARNVCLELTNVHGIHENPNWDVKASETDPNMLVGVRR